jgi:hypothetical protein
MVNGLDFYPTILSLTGISPPDGTHLDGCDLAACLKQDPTDPTLIRESDGAIRDTMVWHFPNSAALESTIRIGDYKLIRNYDHVNNPKNIPLELYQLYETDREKKNRIDIEEKQNLVSTMPEKAATMNERLTTMLSEMNASYPYYNPHGERAPASKTKTPTIISHTQRGDRVEFQLKNNGAEVVHADLIYSKNGGEKYEEWFRGPATLLNDGSVIAQLPKGTTHYYLNVIDENNFLRSYPEVLDPKQPSKSKLKNYAKRALRASTE